MERCKNWYLTLGFIFLCLVGIQFKIQDFTDDERELLFMSYINKFNRNYSENSQIYEDHFHNFQEALTITEEWNTKRSSPDSALYGLSPFADISRDEFTNRYLRGHRKHNHNNTRLHNHHRHNLVKRSIFAKNLPQKIDWREKNAVGAIKNQGLCGACWAFSTVGTIESMAAIKSGVLPILSVQELIDCATNGNLGCSGGDPCALAEWLADNNIKIQPERDYPLILKNGVCKMKNVENGVQIAKNFTCDYLVGLEEQLLETLAYHGPVAVAVNALSWQFYLSGVIEYHCDGSLDTLNHAVQIVGYDLTASIPHYIIRNSWGVHFGERGYVRVAIGNNACGIASEVTALDAKL